MCPILASIPFHRSSEETGSLVDSVVSTDLLGVSVEHHAISARHIDANAVVAEALRGVEVEDEYQSSSLKDNHLVILVLQRDVCLGSSQPAKLGFAVVHEAVKLVQELVAQEMVLGKVELSSGVPEGVVVAFAGEVEPLGVTKLVAFEVEVAFTSQAVGEETDHLVESHTTVYDGRQR